MRQAGKTIREYSEYVEDNLDCTDPVAKAILVHAQALDYLAAVLADGLYAIAEARQPSRCGPH